MQTNAKALPCSSKTKNAGISALGGDELWGLAQRLQRRFPGISSAEYFPKRHSFVSTQVQLK